MLLTILEIAVFMAAAAIIGVALGWVLRGTLGREQVEISDLRAQIRRLKKSSRESQGAPAKNESATAAVTTAAKAASAPEAKKAQAEASKAENKPAMDKAEAKPAEKAASKPKAAPAPKATDKAKTSKKKTSSRKSQAEREADQAAGRAAFAEVVDRIGKGEQQDNLTKIYGVGKRYEAMLNELGITDYAQVAKLRKADLKTLAAALGVLDDRIETEDWVGSAKQLAKEAR